MATQRSNQVIKWADFDAANPNILHGSVIGAGNVTLDLSTMSRANLVRAAWHGMKQRIADAAALERDKETGRSATPSDKHAEMAKLVEHYASGTDDWSVKRAEGAGPNEGLVYEAMMRHYSKSGDEVRHIVGTLAVKRNLSTREALAVFAGTREIIGLVGVIRAERAVERAVERASNVEVLADDLLGEI